LIAQINKNKQQSEGSNHGDRDNQPMFGGQRCDMGATKHESNNHMHNDNKCNGGSTCKKVPGEYALKRHDN
jgi:hypothetical protein